MERRSADLDTLERAIVRVGVCGYMEREVVIVPMLLPMEKRYELQQ